MLKKIWYCDIKSCMKIKNIYTRTQHGLWFGCRDKSVSGGYVGIKSKVTGSSFGT